MATPWLLLLLLPLPALALPAALAMPAAQRARGAAQVAQVALEALVASGEGRVSRGALGALVASAAGRAQCPSEPCGECPSVPAVLALAGKAPGGTAGLDATELSWLGAAVVATLRDPPGACGDPDGDTDGDTEATAGPWASRVRALHREFATDVTGDATGSGTGTVASHGGPGLREVAELLAAIEPNYRGDNGHQACVDARGVLAATSRVSPRVGTGRVLVALGVLVLRGRRLCPGDSGDTPSLQCGDTGSHRGDTGDIDTLHGDTDAHHGDIGDIDTRCGDTDTRHSDTVPRATTHGDSDTRYGDIESHLGDLESHRGPTSPGSYSGDTGDNVTVPVPTNSSDPAEQLNTSQRYVLGTLMALALALVPLVALALVLCPGCSRCPGGSRCPGCSRCPGGSRCRRCPRRWGRPLLDGLAAGALSGDALLHVLPQALGIHGHSGGEHAEHGASHGPPWEMLAVLGGLYGGFVLERLLGGLGPPPEEVKEEDPTPDPAQSTQELTTHGAGGAGSAQALLLSAGGAVHRLADGLALGSAFAASASAGAAAGAGLALHELPRAFGEGRGLGKGGGAWGRGRGRRCTSCPGPSGWS
ncbi:zinc transporter ZIP4-like [Corvus moneduloides]|uniref:zinc transporter ZIP4-like n=1 Tax=Corvus moneduloides TaxID=1196302 RepID=UPI0013635697|nr:zinc transporter ZIP4-like [Corvus moneduloides]